MKLWLRTDRHTRTESVVLATESDVDFVGGCRPRLAAIMESDDGQETQAETQAIEEATGQ